MRALNAMFCSFVALFGVLAHAAPADRLPEPRREPCIPFDIDADVAEGEMLSPEGLSYEEVKLALNGVIQTALYCGQPAGFAAVHLTFELTVGCDGVVSKIETFDDGGAPESYVSCVSNVVKKADFPAHDMEDGMPVTYPVNVAW
ncbi:MAG: hypothetical protein HN348_23035 [Proteobacteria bacterium]|jgi:hypothetical protein|nr:hypothetical protein [Pseudomonadota bacterium]